MSNEINGTFSSVGISSVVFDIIRNFNVSVDMTSALGSTVLIQRTFDEGISWETTDILTESYAGSAFEPERFVDYRLNCTVNTGSILYRIGSSGL